MNTDVILQLILKDWRLHYRIVVLTLVAGAAAMSLFLIRGQAPIVIGSVFFFVSIVFCACLLPVQNIVNETKKQTLPFVMSLPVSSARYGAAKLVSTVGMFLVLWLALFGVALYMILGRHALPNGALPTGTILMGLPVIGFCLTTGTALVGESEGWATAALALTNSSYGLAWYLLISHVPSLPQTWGGPVAVWSPVVFKILGVETAIVVLIVGMTLYLQSRKRNFV